MASNLRQFLLDQIRQREQQPADPSLRRGGRSPHKHAPAFVY
jgi:hypothetical protein